MTEFDTQNSGGLELTYYAHLLWKWLWLILLGGLLAGSAAYIFTSRQAPVYRATAVLLVSGNTNEIVDDYRAILAAQNLIPTYAQQLTGRAVRQDAQEVLGLDQWESTVSTNQIADTQLLSFNVEDTDPALAQELANLMPHIFVEQDTVVQRQRLAAAEENLKEQLAAMQANIDTTAAAITALEKTSNPDPAERIRLQNELYEYQASHATFTHNYQEVRLAQAQLFAPLLISEEAELPTKPVGPRVMQNTLLAVVVGMMLAMGIVFLLEYLDNTVKSPDDVEHLLGFSALGIVPQFAEADAPLVSVKQPRAPATEAYRVLRTNIQLRTLDDSVQSLLITSSQPGEGKTTTLANLGVVMAQNGRSVILIDTDLRRATLHKLFNLPNGQGVTTALLAGNESVTAHLQETAFANLRILTSGPLPPNPSELLGSQKMSTLISQLKEEADILLFDSPPYLSAADGAVLANALDSVLLVVRSGAVRPGTVARIVRSMQEIDARLLGVVLSRYQPKGTDGYGYYNYYGADETAAVTGWRGVWRRVRRQ